MNVINKNALITLYMQKSQRFQKISKPKNFILKKSFLKSKTNLLLTPNNNNITLIHDQEEKSNDNSKIFFNNNSNSNNELVKPLFLPSISNISPNNNKTLLNNSLINNINNSSNNNIILTPKKKKIIFKLKNIKIKKTDERETVTLTPSYMDKKLINLYNEDFYLKQKYEKYKQKKAKNLKNFSFEKYNLNLLKLSSINLSQNSYNTFRKNMQTIENNLNGDKFRRKNRWMIFLEKIGSFAPEGLKKKLKSLSEHKKLEEVKNN